MCPNMTLSIFVKGKVDFRCVQIWLWVFLLKEKLTINMTKYNYKYNKKEKLDFANDKILVWVQSWKKKLILDTSKYDFKHDQIWLWVCLSNEKLKSWL
jgi:hypothetical protein